MNKLLEKLNLNNTFASESDDTDAVQEKSDILASINVDINKIKYLPFKCINITSNILNNQYIEIINVDDIIGTSRLQYGNSSNWYEYFINDAHKMGTIRKFNENGVAKFNNFLINCPDNDLPHLYKINNDYYIGSGGKHRITLAKCIGSREVKALITNIG